MTTIEFEFKFEGIGSPKDSTPKQGCLAWKLLQQIQWP